MKDNTKRIISALIGLPLVVIILVYGNKYIIDVFLAIIAVIAMYEYCNVVSRKCKPVKWIGYLSCALIAVIHIALDFLSTAVIQNILFLLIPLLFLILFAQLIATNMKTDFKDVAYTIFGIIYITICIGSISLLRGIENGKFLIWYAVISAWGTDTFAYTIGRRLGKHKFSEISPKKSIEGCISGTIGAILIALLYTYILNQTWNFGYSYIYISIITGILSLIGQIGDFTASSIKRYADVKDYGNLIPGHGGILDRIDSLMFLAPFAYILLKMII